MLKMAEKKSAKAVLIVNRFVKCFCPHSAQKAARCSEPQLRQPLVSGSRSSLGFEFLGTF